MSSSIANLFGDFDPEKVDAGVSKLFSSSLGPVNDSEVKSKKRTLVASVKEVKQPEQPAKVEEEVTEELTTPVSKKQKKKSEDDTELEDRYYAKLAGEETAEAAPAESVEEGDASDVEEKPKAGESAKAIDLKEDELKKAERTVFVGNLSSEVVTSKKVSKEFKKLFSTSMEGDADPAEFAIESIRFRSISFDEALPRKVAFVQQKLHKSRESVNAYIVYKNRTAVKKACAKFNGHVFLQRHLRVDSVTHPATHENKRSVFVGNLDFEEDDESLWSHFKSCGDIEYVRLVRDAKTNVGKGFAYVQFKDFQSVNKALLLNDKPMQSVKPNGPKRKLRVDRCKNIRKAVGARPSDSKMNEQHKTKIGRAKKVLGRADRATVGKELTVEGLRATKGSGPVSSALKKKKQRSKTGRVTKRSVAFKKSQASS